jgi:hypothetical protein
MTNGRTAAELAELAEREADAEADRQAALDNDEEPEEDRPPTDADYGVAFSPRQVAGGFAIIAAILVLLARRRGRKKR